MKILVPIVDDAFCKIGIDYDAKMLEISKDYESNVESIYDEYDEKLKKLQEEFEEKLKPFKDMRENLESAARAEFGRRVDASPHVEIESKKT